MNEYDYCRNVVNRTHGFKHDCVVGEWIKPDAKKWDMHYYRVSPSYGFYKLGFTSDFCEDGKLIMTIGTDGNLCELNTEAMKKSWNVWVGRDPIKEDFVNGTREIFIELWWCRGGHWRPFWGEATQRHAMVMQSLRSYWFARWLAEQSKKKEILHEKTKLPTVLINDIVDSLPYGYQTKRV